ncbi:hypothetical protein JTB14_010693 [Gonioctena quinquepunctata]|nr:hypothetical protein JTB14_010693 [Gonioctena quinquepunctata]
MFEMDYIDQLSDDEDFGQLVRIVQNDRIFRERENHFEKWIDEEFLKRFRLSKNGARFVLNQIEHLIALPTERNHAVSPEEMLLITSRFHATGSFLQVVGDFIGIHKSTTSRIVWKVTRATANLYNEYIRMPATEEEMKNVSQKFYNISRFPT